VPHTVGARFNVPPRVSPEFFVFTLSIATRTTRHPERKLPASGIEEASKDLSSCYDLAMVRTVAQFLEDLKRVGIAGAALHDNQVCWVREPDMDFEPALVYEPLILQQALASGKVMETTIYVGESGSLRREIKAVTLKCPPHIPLTVRCPECRETQIVEIRAATGAGTQSQPETKVQCSNCGREFRVTIPDELIGGQR
jgi:ribosomal protein S27E